MEDRIVSNRAMFSVSRRRILKGAVLVGAGVLTPLPSVQAQSELKITPMPDDMTPDDIINLLKLEPNATCGFVRVTFRSERSVAPGGLPAPFADGRPLGSALYFLVTPSAPVRLHRIRNDQLYHCGKVSSRCWRSARDSRFSAACRPSWSRTR